MVRTKRTAQMLDVVAPPSQNRLISTRRLAPSAIIDRRVVAVNLAESPLAWLTRRGMVTARQFEAGERLRGDFMRAGTMPSVTMNWQPSTASKGARGAPAGLDSTMARLQARERFDGAVAAAGPGLSDILWRVVCMGEGLETAERALSWPARAAKLVLCLALDRVADHYKVA